MIEMCCNARLVSSLLNMCSLQLHGQKGQLLWHKEDDSMWLFSVMDNPWYSAGQTAKLVHFLNAIG